jgi:nucleoid DNA-binding protein
MRQRHGIALFALLGVLGLLLGLADSARSQRPGQQAPMPIKDRIAKEAKLKPVDVQAMLNQLGPAVQEQLRSGAQVEIAGLGTFRVVRIPEHKDMVDGKPATIGATNYVEFLPSGPLTAAANSAGAVAAETVDPFAYIVDPYHVPSMRVGTNRNPGTRTR